VLAAADSGNGVSGALDYTRYVFINPDLTVHLHRQPLGEWVCLDARTVVEPSGVGLATATLFDEHGPLGTSLQSLYVAAR
jgi:acyl-CoA thioesterase